MTKTLIFSVPLVTGWKLQIAFSSSILHSVALQDDKKLSDDYLVTNLCPKKIDTKFGSYPSHHTIFLVVGARRHLAGKNVFFLAFFRGCSLKMSKNQTYFWQFCTHFKPQLTASTNVSQLFQNQMHLFQIWPPDFVPNLNLLNILPTWWGVWKDPPVKWKTLFPLWKLYGVEKDEWEEMKM